MSMKKSSETLGNRTRDLPACSAVPHNGPNNNLKNAEIIMSRPGVTHDGNSRS